MGFSSERRQFLGESVKKLTCALLALFSTLVPAGVGFLFFLDPLRRKGHPRGFARVASLDSLPVGVARKFTIPGVRTDAWNTYPNVPIGAVYLIRQPDGVEALQVICPHAGCFVDYNPAKAQFLCPCHGSSFDLSGSIADPGSPSPRGLDRLEVRLQGKDVLVRYQEFRQGIRERIPVA